MMMNTQIIDDVITVSNENLIHHVFSINPYVPEKIRETKPDFVLILPWNLKDEIVLEHGYIREWGGQFVVPIPEVDFLT